MRITKIIKPHIFSRQWTIKDHINTNENYNHHKPPSMLKWHRSTKRIELDLKKFCAKNKTTKAIRELYPFVIPIMLWSFHSLPFIFAKLGSFKSHHYLLMRLIAELFWTYEGSVQASLRNIFLDLNLYHYTIYSTNVNEVLVFG